MALQRKGGRGNRSALDVVMHMREGGTSEQGIRRELRQRVIPGASGSVPGAIPVPPFYSIPGIPSGTDSGAKKYEKERFLSAPVFRVSVTAY